MAEEKKTENPLATKIGKDLLQCAICHDQYQDPRGLPCQHGFCRQCLESWAKSSEVKGKLMCPTCREEVSLSKDGVKGLPVHFLVSSLKDMCGEKKTVVCSNCNKPGRKARFYCFDCKENLCEECHTHHMSLKLTKHHKVATVEDYQSGKVSDDGRYCKFHGELFRYFCETEMKQVCTDCIALKTCPVEHERSSVKDAATKQTIVIEQLIAECDATKLYSQDAIKKIEKISNDFEEAKKQARGNLDRARKEHIHHIEEMFKKHEASITKEDVEKTKQIADRKDKLENHLMEIEKACKESHMVLQSGSDHHIVSSYVSLVDILEHLKQEPIAAEGIEVDFTFQAYSPVVHDIGYLSAAPWKLVGQFKSPLSNVKCIAINQDGDIAIKSPGNHIRIVTRTGEVKYTFQNSPYYVCDFTVTPDNKYIVRTDGSSNFLFFNREGKRLSETFDYDMYLEPSNSYGVAVDTRGRIVAGLENKTIAIHYSDGTIINDFATHAIACRLDVTSKEELVVCFDDSTLKLMDFSGNNVRDIEPPSDVTTWNPCDVCCSHKYGEILVINKVIPVAIYRYTSEGKYLGRVTIDGVSLVGIAVSPAVSITDEEHVIVAEESDNQIKIFKRY